jgi:vacuolar-type H+-ATPase subunit F/Vma7
MLTEQVAHMLEDEVNRHRLAATPPYIVEVPDIWATDVGRPSLEQLIQEAVGIRIVHDTNERESGT